MLIRLAEYQAKVHFLQFLTDLTCAQVTYRLCFSSVKSSTGMVKLECLSDGSWKCEKKKVRRRPGGAQRGRLGHVSGQRLDFARCEGESRVVSGEMSPTTMPPWGGGTARRAVDPAQRDVCSEVERKLFTWKMSLSYRKFKQAAKTLNCV